MKTKPEFVWRVENAGRPSIRALLKQLAQAIADTSDAKPLDRDSGVFLQVQYGAKGTGWVSGASKKRSHHLNAPSASAVSELVGELVAAAGLCTMGQIVGCYATKVVTPETNYLSLTLSVVVVDAKRNPLTRKHKLLQWYLATCDEAGKRPTSGGFYALLRKLKQGESATMAAIEDELFKKAQG